MRRSNLNAPHRSGLWRFLLSVVTAAALTPVVTPALQLEVVDRNGQPVSGPFKWLVEEDTTTVTVPGIAANDSISVVIHKSHAPVVATGEVTSGNTLFTNLPTDKRYVVSVMKDGYSTGGGIAPANFQGSLKIVVNAHPIPTSQISVLVFHDNSPINNAPDVNEVGLEGFRIILADVAGGPLLTDAFGNPLGTTYQFDPGTGDPVMTPDGPVVDQIGTGKIYTDAEGKALVKYIAPGKYGVQVIPPDGTAWTGGHGTAQVKGKWHQTATIEGTLTVDAWVKANEPKVFLEGFGPGFYHVFFGFVDPGLLVWETNAPPVVAGNQTITGTNVFNHFGRPPVNQMFAVGPPVGEAWIGLNEMIGGLPGQGLYAAPCNPDGSFTITNVPPGEYQLVTWDKPLDALFGFNTLIVTNGPNNLNNLGNVLSYRWFGTLEGSIFYDDDEDGFKDPSEEGIPNLAVNLRFRDGTIYQAGVTDAGGDYVMSEVFPFFKWLIAEVDFSRFKATGMTAVVDEGGPIPPDNGWIMPSEGVRNPQPQYAVNADGVADTNSPIINPNTGNEFSRTEQGPVLTEAMHLFLNQNNRIDWGKANYGPGENGGISGIVFYSTTRAENDPRDAVGDGWEPGVPRVQVALYEYVLNPTIPPGTEATITNRYYIKDFNGDGPTLADVDNHPLGWADGGARGNEDVDYNGNGTFDPGDAIQITWTDSFDDVIAEDPTLGAIQTNPPWVTNSAGVRRAIVGADNYGTWNQIRPCIFDGGYAFTSYHPGGKASGSPETALPAGNYIVQAVPPPGYLIQTEESRNVDFGDEYIPSKLWLPPACVGDLHLVPPYLTLFPEKQVPAPFAGQLRPYADRKLVEVLEGKNTAADFHVYTEVPKAARVVGFVLNDFTAEFNAFSPIFGEKGSPGWLPISIQDWTGTEVCRVYSDEFGTYNAMLPSTYTVNVPSPSGVSPNMLTLVLNHPTRPDGTPDPYYNPNFSTTPWTFQFYPGGLTYLDTPIVPIAALVGYPNNQLDAEPANNTPVIKSVSSISSGVPLVGPHVQNLNDTIVITSMGTAVQVPDPRSLGYQTNANIVRNYGFGPSNEVSKVTINGTPLTLVSWNANTIQAQLPAGTGEGEYQLMVTRNNGNTSPIGVTLTFGMGPVLRVPAPTPSTAVDPFPTPIQTAIDAAPPGALILVGPGSYNENPVLYKAVRLQGSGAGTTISANPTPTDRLAMWHAKVTAVLGGDPFVANEAPGIMVFGLNGTDFNANNARIDGFQIMGSLAGGGITLFNNANNVRISNNRIIGNQGSYGGGIVLGVQGNAGILYHNTNVTIQLNQVLKNGAVDGAGGIAIYTGATGYKILDNYVIGNFCRRNGGGISHVGVSPGGLIAGNTIAFNEVFYGVLQGGDGGGIYLTGDQLPGGLSTGAGSVTIRNNLIQGNLAGSGNGGGIRVAGMNGNDVQASPGNPNDWYALDIINNIIVDNVAGWAGGGIALQDATRVRIIHNTIARNDATATSRSAFDVGATNSTPQVAGLAVHPHSLALAALVPGQLYSNPELVNNIIHRNNSWYFDGTLQMLQPRTTTPPTATSQWWELGVVGQPGALLNPTNCLLRVGYAGGDDNLVVGNPRFLAPYDNTLHTAVVIDEAGNNISVRNMQLVVGTGNNARVNYGNYHIGTVGGVASPAIDAGTAATSLAVNSDFDRQFRVTADIGADEVSAAAATELLVATAPLAGPPATGTVPGIAPPGGAGVPPGDPVLPTFVPPPADMDGVDTDGDSIVDNDHAFARVSGGDGFSRMADGNELYQFGFSDLTAVAPEQVMEAGKLAAEIPAPTLVLNEGWKFFLDLANVGMLMRPDLFDPHTVHFHGFPQAASIFDGEPFASISINVGATLRYFYNIVEPGTYIYHCHVEATEHMEMGMLGSLYVRPKQNYTGYAGNPATVSKLGGNADPAAPQGYAYNDGDGSTAYDVEYPLQLSAFDRVFHEQHIEVQPLPFSDLDESYPMINGRGYPDTVSTLPVTNSLVSANLGYNTNFPSQKVSSLITAKKGQRILLRLSNVSLSDFHTITVLGIPMRVVAKDAKLLRSPAGLDLSYETTSFTFGGGETVDFILNTANTAPGTYFLYDARLNHLSNDVEDFGGMMTEIRITE